MFHVSSLKSIKVTCALIEQDGKVLCAQRSERMKHPLKWEFPGGKVEENEDLEACLKREIKEELNLEIELIEQLPSNTHSYSTGISIKLIPFRCRLLSSEILLKEHRQIQWLKPEQLTNLDWAEADVPIVEYYLKAFS